MWLTAILLITLAVGTASALARGTSRWKSKIKNFRATLETHRLHITPATYDAREIDGLPPPVSRYFRAVLQDGQPIIAGVLLSQDGQFQQSDSPEDCRPFEATEMVTTRPPAFDWDARIRSAPFMKVYVHDAYAEGRGILHAALLGSLNVAHMGDSRELAEGELQRYLAEAVWFPTALLPSQGVSWEAIDDSTARATLRDGNTSASLEFQFNQEGLITSAFAPLRHRAVNGVLQPTPWQGRFSGYARRGGMRIPLEGEVEWQLPTGPLPYWRGRITQIEYEFAINS